MANLKKAKQVRTTSDTRSVIELVGTKFTYQSNFLKKCE